jgi:hypothetical protein
MASALLFPGFDVCNAIAHVRAFFVRIVLDERGAVAADAPAGEGDRGDADYGEPLVQK